MAQQTNTQMNEKVPTNYTLCIKRDCPKAETCLHHVATQMMPAEIQKWSGVTGETDKAIEDAKK